MKAEKLTFDIKQLLKVEPVETQEYFIYTARSVTGVIYVTKNNPGFLSGQWRMRGRNEGQYPLWYIEALDELFGYEPNTIEVCSRHVDGRQVYKKCFTVDINPKFNPDMVTDGQTLAGIPNSKFDRWRCDPPYNEHTAEKMYGTKLPLTSKLLAAGARVCNPGSLMFLLLGPQNYQFAPRNTIRVGFIAITIVPNNELRALNIYYKLKNDKNEDHHQSQLGFSMSVDHHLDPFNPHIQKEPTSYEVELKA